MLFEHSWIVFGLCAVMLWTLIPLLQEKKKIDPFALAVWNKIGVATVLLPLVLHFGFPDKPEFYAVTFATAVLWAISDVLFFRAIPVVGAAVVTRLIPSAIIFTFFAWFLFDHALFLEYLQHPVKSIILATVVLLPVYFASRLRKCTVSLQAVRMIWFVIFAASAGSIMVKLLLDTDPTPRGVFAYVFVQAVMMLALWGLYALWRRPLSVVQFLSPAVYKTGLAVGLLSSAVVSLKGFSLVYVDHPAYLSVILLLDSVLISLLNRVRGKKDGSDMRAGFGIVACAAIIVMVKIWG